MELKRCGAIWKDKEGFAYGWLDDAEMFMRMSTGEVFKITSIINDDCVLVD